MFTIFNNTFQCIPLEFEICNLSKMSTWYWVYKLLENLENLKLQNLENLKHVSFNPSRVVLWGLVHSLKSIWIETIPFDESWIHNAAWERYTEYRHNRDTKKERVYITNNVLNARNNQIKTGSFFSKRYIAGLNIVTDKKRTKKQTKWNQNKSRRMTQSGRVRRDKTTSTKLWRHYANGTNHSRTGSLGTLVVRT